MADKVEVDVIRRVFVPHSEGAFIELGPWPDAPGTTIELRTTEKGGIDYFGKVNLVLPVEYAKALGEALVKAADDLRAGDPRT